MATAPLAGRSGILLSAVALLAANPASAAGDAAARTCPPGPGGEASHCPQELARIVSASLLQRRQQLQPARASAQGVCDADSLEFSAAHCHQITLGVSEPKHLLEEERWGSGPSLAALGARRCSRKFHALSLDEAERLQPALKSCLVSTWAAKLYRSLRSAPCAEDSPDGADVVVLPGYTAVECNWPLYGGGVCTKRQGVLSNFARDGTVCRGADTLVAYRELQRALGKRVVVLENSPNPRGNKYDLPDGSIYAAPSMSWAMVGADAPHYRLGADISVPPGPSVRCKLGDPASRAAISLSEPLEKKAYLATFKGGLHMHSFRVTARDALHDDKKVIIADSSDTRWDFDDLLFDSVFALILRGDAIMTTRVNEAVCSGGIPVLVTDSWIPPFNETVPWESFGLIHSEKDLSSLRGRLEGVGAQQRDALREAAHRACEGSFQTIEAHAASLAEAIGHIAEDGAGASR